MGYVLPSSGCLSVCVATMLGCNSRMVSFALAAHSLKRQQRVRLIFRTQLNNKEDICYE